MVNTAPLCNKRKTFIHIMPCIKFTLIILWQTAQEKGDEAVLSGVNYLMTFGTNGDKSTAANVTSPV